LAQITSVTSEALQAAIRSLLPSQQGFGEDLQASNVIVPVIDLTATAEGSALPTYLQSAWGLSDITAFAVSNATTTLVNTTGFYNVYGTYYYANSGSGTFDINFSLTDGTTTKKIWMFNSTLSANVTNEAGLYNFTVFLRAGDSLTATTNKTFAQLNGSTRPVADINGNLINPTGFTPT
jgi:hypothetical protein